MEVLRALDDVPDGHASAVTIGFFDGVHRGHRAVIGRTVHVARERGLRSVVVTFDRHPLETLSPGKVPSLLTTLEQKAELIDELGVDALFVLGFTEEVSRWSPEGFVDRVLARGLEARFVIVGTNFTFGHRAAGNLPVLADLGQANGFDVEGMGINKLDGRPVSSTAIREALVEGDLTWAERALGRRFAVRGRVVAGAGRGANLGFPTANLETPPGMLLPGMGVYAGRAFVDGDAWIAAINIGVNPTFGRDPLHLEAYLLGFDGDLRGRPIEVEFWARLRDEQRFASAEALSRQIAEDVERTKEIVPTS
ncbi:MAG TPA: bifunctional riboflavin kinase/FAD synthetase [Actinomycetota bacterium]|nr:bifunctional riboflavin kinase/FAD synthetase [Actinomycetota bacterium]